MAKLWKNKQEYEAFFQQHYEAGRVIHRAGDFHEKVQLILLDPCSISDLAQTIESAIPESIPINVVVLKGQPVIYLFTTEWKAAIDVMPLSQDIYAYRFWFAEPPISTKSLKHANVAFEMNVAATAAERAFLQSNKAARVAMAYASAKDRHFEIGPRAATNNMPDVSRLFSKDLPFELSLGWAKGFVKDVSVEMVFDYLVERKNDNKLGYAVVSDFLGSRFLDTPACPPEVQQHFGLARQQHQAARYCRKCGTLLNEGARFCMNCGTEVSTSTSAEA